MSKEFRDENGVDFDELRAFVDQRNDHEECRLIFVGNRSVIGVTFDDAGNIQLEIQAPGAVAPVLA